MLSRGIISANLLLIIPPPKDIPLVFGAARSCSS